MSRVIRHLGDSPGQVTTEDRALAVDRRQYEGELRALLDAIPDLVWLKDPEGVYLDCNPAVESLFGVCKSEILGKTDYDFFDRSLADFVREQDRKACSAGKPVSNEEWLTPAASGQRRLYEATRTAMRDAGGRLSGMLGIARDITERAEREKSDAMLSQQETGIIRVLDNAADAIFVADQHGDYQYVNEQAVRLLGFSRDELLRMRVGDLTPGEDRSVFERLSQELWSSGSLCCELRLRHRSGGVIPVDFNGTMLPDGRAYISCRDIRARKLADAEREQQREALVREVHHRIKNNLQGVAGLLQRELGKFQELDPRLDVAISQINAIAVVHGLQAASPDEAPCLCASVRDICRMVSELAQRPVLLHVEETPGSSAARRINPDDAISVALVLNELILNAVKHSPHGSCAPTVSLRAVEASIELRIRNVARGVPDFDFAVGDGLGTGLSLVRSLLPKQGAHLYYQFDALSGFMLTTLHLTAPVVLARPEEEQ